MNAPLPDSVRKALETVTLDDKYALETGRAFMSGVQALVRLPMLQRQRVAKAGLNTAGFVSGYRGSPLGGYDLALWQAKKHLAAQNIVFQPGVNEELAATAVWGTQMLDLYPQSRKFDGVFGIWYGKGPGVDRCSDVFKHANMAGTSQHGGPSRPAIAASGLRAARMIASRPFCHSVSSQIDTDLLSSSWSFISSTRARVSGFS